MPRRAPIFFRDSERTLERKLNALAVQVDESVSESQILRPVFQGTPDLLKIVEITALNDGLQLLEVKEFQSTLASFNCLLPPIFTETARGAITFVYSDLNNRTATEGPTVETQQITPSLIVGEAVQAAYFSELDIWQFISDGRMWAKTG